MTRTEALELISLKVSNKNLIKHMLACEACMKKLAEYFGEDPERWGLVGLLHDLDYDETSNNPEKHALITCEILKDKGFSDEELNAIRAHAGHAERESKMASALYAVDPMTGLIVAATLMHPSRKLQNVDRDFVLRRYKEKNFARGANREQIAQCQKLGLSLEEFTQICLEAMKEITDELGL
ncbi:MAG: HDIG domain-containing protein [candidate division WOR-3 bacterium]|nr:HDIG domain-containing protein [candidate division WOR-3 bacterium]MCX7757904.1 HDIG domain-containing protein [candidate division WOR-3 bacterium]MDW7987359.1 HDIG domain-containing protein [candidate division WOR-3 bacterium]